MTSTSSIGYEYPSVETIPLSYILWLCKLIEPGVSQDNRFSVSCILLFEVLPLHRPLLFCYADAIAILVVVLSSATCPRNFQPPNLLSYPQPTAPVRVSYTKMKNWKDLWLLLLGYRSRPQQIFCLLQPTYQIYGLPYSRLVSYQQAKLFWSPVKLWKQRPRSNSTIESVDLEWEASRAYRRHSLATNSVEKFRYHEVSK